MVAHFSNACAMYMCGSYEFQSFEMVWKRNTLEEEAWNCLLVIFSYKCGALSAACSVGSDSNSHNRLQTHNDLFIHSIHNTHKIPFTWRIIYVTVNIENGKTCTNEQSVLSYIFIKSFYQTIFMFHNDVFSLLLHCFATFTLSNIFI